jgi:hypothetical protein
MAYFDSRQVDRFIERLSSHRGLGPMLFRQPFSAPLAAEAEYMDVLRCWARDVRAGAQRAPSRWLDEGLVPSADDRDLAAFCRRVDERWSSDWFLYLPDGIQRWKPALWHRLIEIVRPLVDCERALPPGGFTFDLFLGRYDRTPFGIHRDESDSIAFVTCGPKRLYFWPPECFVGLYDAGSYVEVGTSRFERYLDRATVIDADAGDVIYWPRDYYHIGASPDHWSGMMSLGLWWHACPADAIRRMVSALLPGNQPPSAYSIEPAPPGRWMSELPGSLAAAAELAEDALTSGWETAPREMWVRFSTAYWFWLPPARAATPPAARGVLRHPIAILELDQRYHFYACGSDVGTTASEALAKHVRSLSSGAIVTASSMLSAAAGNEPAADDVTDLLHGLYSVGAVEAIT